MKEVNYYLEFVKEYKEIRNKENTKPKLLLHVCCGACSAYPLVFLHDLFDITIFYSNSNIYPKNEYDKRLNSLKKYVEELNKTFKTHIIVIEDEYDHSNFIEDLIPYKNQKEGLDRCKICIKKRMIRLFEYAKKENYKYVTTVMTVSRNKDVNYINKLGEEINQAYPGIRYIYSDFKKNNGQDIGVKIAKQYNIYRQSYCGCEFSFPFKEKNEKELGIILVANKISANLKNIINELNNINNLDYEVTILLEDFSLKENEMISSLISFDNKDKFKIFNTNFNDLALLYDYAIKNSNAKYFIFINQDDLLKKDFFNNLSSILKENDSEIILPSSLCLINKNNKDEIRKINNKEEEIMNKSSLINKLIRKRYLINGLSLRIFKKEFIYNNSIFFLSSKLIYEDIFFNFLAILLAKKIRFYNFNDLKIIKSSFNKFNDSSLITKNIFKMINTLFLIKYVLIKNKLNEDISLPLFKIKYLFLYQLIKNRYYLDISLFTFIKLINKEMKKLFNDTYIYEGEEWEKVIYLYRQKEKNYYK